MRTTRRQILKDGALLAAASAALGRKQSWAAGSSLATAASAITPPLSTFKYSEVQLLDGPLKEQFDHNHDVFLHLNEDALLKPFRQREGMAAPGPDMGGWYDNADDFSPPENFHAFVPGHSFGQYLSGLARAYAVTGNKPTKEKVLRRVGGFEEPVDRPGKFCGGSHLPAYTF